MKFNIVRYTRYTSNKITKNKCACLSINKDNNYHQFKNIAKSRQQTELLKKKTTLKCLHVCCGLAKLPC